MIPTPYSLPLLVLQRLHRIEPGGAVGGQRAEDDADQQETGIWNGVSSPTDKGMARPISVPTSPPESERKTASVRNCIWISRLVAPSALRMPISLVRACTLASIEFMMPTPETIRVTPAARPMTAVSMVAIWSILVSTSRNVWAR